LLDSLPKDFRQSRTVKVVYFSFFAAIALAHRGECFQKTMGRSGRGWGQTESVFSLEHGIAAMVGGVLRPADRCWSLVRAEMGNIVSGALA